MAALPLQTAITQTSSSSTDFKVIETKYGNGYSQRAPDGINNQVDMWEITWETLNNSDFTSLIAAIVGAKGVTPFTWTAPGDATEKKWVIRKYTKRAESGEYYSVSASLEQVYDI